MGPVYAVRCKTQKTSPLLRGHLRSAAKNGAVVIAFSSLDNARKVRVRTEAIAGLSHVPVFLPAVRGWYGHRGDACRVKYVRLADPNRQKMEVHTSAGPRALAGNVLIDIQKQQPTASSSSTAEELPCITTRAVLPDV